MKESRPTIYVQEEGMKLQIGDLAISVFSTLLEKNAAGKATIERIPRTIEGRNETDAQKP